MSRRVCIKLLRLACQSLPVGAAAVLDGSFFFSRRWRRRVERVVGVERISQVVAAVRLYFSHVYLWLISYHIHNSLVHNASPNQVSPNHVSSNHLVTFSRFA